MVSEQVCQLLTAYVDGELGPRQQEAVLRLVRQSPEAQALLQQLLDNAKSLRNLPPRKPGRDLSRQVLRSIAERRLQPVSPIHAALGLSIGVWAGMAAAAAILFAIAVGSYSYFSAPEHVSSVSPIAKNSTQTKPEPQPQPQREPGPNESNDGAIPELIPPPHIETVQNTEPKPPHGDPASPPEDTRLTIPPRDPKGDQIDKIDLRLPETFVLRHLDEPEPAAKLKAELAKDRAYRLELFCLDSTKAFGRVQAGLQAVGVQVVLDAEAQQRLSGRRKSHYVLFAEDLLPDEVFKLLQQLGVNDKKAEAQRTGDGQFGKLVVSRLGDLDLKELGKLLGVDPKHLEPVKSKGPLGVDPRKPLPEQTADHVARTLAGQGSAKPSSGNPTIRRALVIAYTPERTRSAPSKEMKLFLDGRKEPRPGSVQVMFIVRAAD